MKPHMPLDELLDALARNAALPDELAEATPPQIYTSPEFLELELDEIFNHEWFCVGREDEYENPGDYRATTIGRDPVIVLRDRGANCARCRTSAVTGCRRFWKERATSRAASAAPTTPGPTIWTAS